MQFKVASALRGLMRLCAPGTQKDIPPECSFRADPRLWRARKGIFGSFKLYLGLGEKVIFHVWSFIHDQTGKRLIYVYPVSYYKDNVLVMRMNRTEDGKQPFLSGGILFGKFDINLLPEKHRAELGEWANLILRGVKAYDDRISHSNFG